MNNAYILESMASDLKRVAMGYHRGSTNMARRFLSEALLRRDEVDMKQIKPYMRKVLSTISHDVDSEYACMCATLLQNYAQQLKKSK